MDIFDAVIKGDTHQVRQFLVQGVDPNLVEDGACISLLHYAAQKNRIEIAMLLVDAGARVDAATLPDGETPLDVALLHGHEQLAQLLMHYISHGSWRGTLQ